MSQRPPASRPASRSPPDGQRITLPPVQLRDDAQEGQRQAERSLPESEGRGLPQIQPSPQQSRASPAGQAGEDWRPAPPRDRGFHSILNPTEPERSSSVGRRPSAGLLGSPSMSGPGIYGIGPATAAPQHSFPSHRGSAHTPPIPESYGSTFPRRRILTPRSPRVTSMGRAGGQDTIDARRSPFLPSRGRLYTAEPGPSASSDIPLMPTPPGQHTALQQYGFPPVATPNIDRRASMASMHAPGRTPLSQSASPSISASSQNPSSSQTSPASFAGHKISTSGPLHQSSTLYFPGSSFGSTITQQGIQLGPGPGHGSGIAFQEGQGQASGGGMLPAEGPFLPSAAPIPSTQSQVRAPSSSSMQGSTSYGTSGGSRQTSSQGEGEDAAQFLTLTTAEGNFSVPVDVHQASRVANEKRARNAGASARFRARRKEKEKEASTNIDRLQSNVREMERRLRELESERDWYREERDRLRDLILRNEGSAGIRAVVSQGPPSPRSLRVSGLSGPGGSMGGPPPPPPEMMGRPGMTGYPPPIPQIGGPPPPTPTSFSQDHGQGRAARRRRTDDQGGYTNQPYSLAPASTLPPVQPPGYHPQGPQNLPPLRIDNTTQPPPTSGERQPPSSTSGPSPFGNYGRGPFEREWPGEGGRR